MEPPLCRPSNVLLILLIFSIVFVRSNAEVVTLTADTFTDKVVDSENLHTLALARKVKEKDTVWFVKFCVPWCKYCKKLGTLWEDLGKTVEAEDEIEVGEVDCSLNKAVCTKVNIHSYPTFKMFYDGEEFAKYQVVSHGARYYLTCFQKSILPCSGGDMSSAFKLWVMILC